MGKLWTNFKKGDIVAIAAVVVLAAVVFFAFVPREKASAPMAEIYLNGELVKTVSLSANQEFTLSGDYTNTISIRDQKIAITRADCPGEDCVSSGWQHSAGRSIVCLPNGLEIRIISANSGVDFAVG